jgi:protein-S-isoprenylcysteine O-methyltransferase Ste14
MMIGIYQSAAILSIFIVFYLADFWLMHRYDKLRATGSSRSWAYTVQAIFMAILIILQPVLLPWLGISTSASWGLLIQAIGVALVICGLFLHWWARTNLGQYYGEREEVQQGQHLIYRGPYVYIRHPIYTSYFILVSGVLLIVPALTTLLVTIYAFWDFLHAVAREEKLLVEQLPGYTDYIARTPRFFPRLTGRSERK